jgi:hypothetical protein
MNAFIKVFGKMIKGMVEELFITKIKDLLEIGKMTKKMVNLYKSSKMEINMLVIIKKGEEME